MDKLMNTIGESTGIKLGLVLTIIALLGGGLTTIGLGVWWASGLTADVKNMQTMLVGLTTTSSKNGSDIEDLKRRLTTLEVAGSPKAGMLEREIQDIRRMIEVHMSKDVK